MLQLQLPTHSGALGTSMRTAPQWHEPLSGMPQLSARYSRDEGLRDVQPRDRFFQRLAVVAVLLDEVENLVGRQAVLVGEIAHFAGVARRNAAAVALRVGHHPLLR